MTTVTPTDDTQHVASDAEQRRIQLVSFRLDQHLFAVPVEQVWRVEALVDCPIARVPGAATFLEGLISLRGRVIPVIDLKKRLGLSSSPPAPEQIVLGTAAVYPPKARLLIVEMEIAGQADEKVAMIVDTVNDIRWFPAASLRPPPPMVAEISGEYLLGVLEEAEQLWIVLDLRRVLSVEERHSLSSEVEKGQEANNAPVTGEAATQNSSPAG